MGLIETASGNSVWRGMDYYREHKVTVWSRTGETTYAGTVSGSNGEAYQVYIDKAHPRKSVCGCAFARGRRVVCKHMIALYFTAEPEAADHFLKQVELWEKEEAEEEERRLADLRRYVNSLSKAELRARLYDALVELEDRRNRYW